MKKAILIAMFLFCSACGRGFSEGDRAGFVVKLSYKGFLFKTWEGSMHLAGNNSGGGGSGSDVWDFSVIDSAVVSDIQKAVENGDRVSLHYVQWVMANPLKTDTDYEVVGVKVNK